MKKITPLLALLLFFLATSASFAQDRGRKAPPRRVTKRAFEHNSHSSKGKTERMQFRRENDRPVIDLNPRSPEKFKTAKANKNYKYSKGR